MPGTEEGGVDTGRVPEKLEEGAIETQKVSAEENSKTAMGEHSSGGDGETQQAGASDSMQPGTTGSSSSDADTELILDATASVPDGDVGGGVGAVGGVGGGFFAQAREFGSLNKAAAVGLVVDIDPRHPAVLSGLVAAVVAILLSVWWGCSKASRKRAHRHVRPVGGGVNALETASPVGGAGYNTRGGRTGQNASPSPAAKPRTPNKVMIMTPEQASLCEVLYDVYGGVVPSQGINSRAVRDCDLKTAEIRRQFRSIKQAREAKTMEGKLNSPGSPLRGRSSIVSPKAGKESAGRGKGGRGGSAQSPSRMLASRLPAKRASSAKPKKAPTSPKKTPMKRGPATRPTPSPKSGGSVEAKRTAGSKVAAVAAVGKAAKQGEPTTPDSPMVTRGKNPRAPSPGSPMSTPKKRAATAAAVGGGRGRKGASSPKNTPSKRGASSLLEIARREAQQKTGAAASTRANSLSSKSQEIGITPSVTRSKRAKS